MQGYFILNEFIPFIHSICTTSGFRFGARSLHGSSSGWEILVHYSCGMSTVPVPVDLDWWWRNDKLISCIYYTIRIFSIVYVVIIIYICNMIFAIIVDWIYILCSIFCWYTNSTVSSFPFLLLTIIHLSEEIFFGPSSSILYLIIHKYFWKMTRIWRIFQKRFLQIWSR